MSDPNEWDEELERLSAFVVEHFGQQAWDDAVERALAKVKQSRPSDPENLQSTSGLRPVFYEALRTELKQLTKPH